MFPTKIYDMTRFASEEEAEAAGEMYKVEYTASEIKITTPDGTIKTHTLQHESRFGLDIDDVRGFEEIVNEDMEKRAKENDAKQNKNDE